MTKIFRNTEKSYTTAITGVKNDLEIKTRDKKIIMDFHDFCILQGQKKKTLISASYNLRKLAKLLYQVRRGATFLTATKHDITRLCVNLEQNDYTYHAKRELKKSLKKLDKWQNNGEYSDRTRWIKTTDMSKKLPKTYTPEELTQLFDQVEDLEVLTALLTLYESSLRIEEHLTLKKDNIEFTRIEGRFVAILYPNGKTGERRVILKDTAELLLRQIKRHPLNKYVFVWNYQQFRYKMLKIGQHLDIKKLKAHRFRHTRATFLANYLTDAELCAVHGWKIGSRMPSVYVALSGIRGTLDKKITALPKMEIRNPHQTSFKQFS